MKFAHGEVSELVILIILENKKIEKLIRSKTAFREMFFSIRASEIKKTRET